MIQIRGIAMLITSTANERVKNVSKLVKQAKERKNQGLFVVEGIRMVKEIPTHLIHSLYVEEDCQEKYADMITKVSGENRLGLGNTDTEVNKTTIGEDRCFILKKHVFESIADTNSPQGILALVKMRNYSLEDILGENPFVLIIEKLQDPGNLGTILRTAEGAGATGILLSSDSVDLYNPKVVRSTMGAMFRMPVYVSDNIIEDVKKLKEKKIIIYGAHLDGNPFYDKNFKIPCGFLIGNEGNGLSKEISATADELLRIPMKGQVESLNAAISTSVIAYEVLRQREYS